MCSVCALLPYMRQREAGADDLERLLALRALVAVDDGRGVQQPTRDDGHLVPARGQLRRLAVHVFGDAAELRVVVVRDDRDAHAGAENTLAGRRRVGCWHCLAESANLRRRWYHDARMPTYDYLCENGHRFELVQRFTEDALDKCVECGAPCKRLLHAPAIHFKGSGFYSTDYGSKKRGPNGAGQESKAESGASERRRRRRAATRRRARSGESSKTHGEQRQQAGELVELERLVQLLRLSGRALALRRRCSPATTPTPGRASAARCGRGTRRSSGGSPRSRSAPTDRRPRSPGSRRAGSAACATRAGGASRAPSGRSPRGRS